MDCLESMNRKKTVNDINVRQFRTMSGVQVWNRSDKSDQRLTTDVEKLDR